MNISRKFEFRYKMPPAIEYMRGYSLKLTIDSMFLLQMNDIFSIL